MAVVSTKYGVGSTRITRQINRKPASHIHHAIRIAEAIGRPLTHFVTINFSHTRCPAELVSPSFERLRNDRFGPWIRRAPRRTPSAASPPTYVWVIENKDGIMNVHWLVHIPENRLAAFKTKLPKWLMNVTGAIIQDGAIDIRPITNFVGLSRYILKGTDPAWAAFYGAIHIDQGEVHGKRSGYSENTGPTAKQRLREAGQYRNAWRRTKAADQRAAA